MEILQYPFFLKALLTAFMTSILCGLIGSYIVSRRIVFIGGGITHTSFGGIGLGYYLGVNPVITAAIFGVLSAIGIKAASDKADIREDSAIGIFWALGMALGIIFIYLTPGYAPDLMTYLFGNILMVSMTDIYIITGLGIVASAVFYFLFNEIHSIAFDEEFAKTQGIRVNLINYTLISLVALTIVFNIKVVGIILVMSLLTIPQTAASVITKNFKTMIFLSIIIAVISSFAGLVISYYFNIPSGASIIFSSVIIFVIIKLFYNLRRKKR
ncbi:MAG: metal ABC transporter permease [Candidatus Delongbacteria bacterium]|nr:metal ABC transporter permease [Candidatus Delongbacteria bacterium]MDD4205133.1 metal ABC transporter permease [Candidatus Delongbacteria bacterium]MDY0016868.1 metal ABC transporter permease [Candidatus Delongbacteria bacterium]